MIIAALQCGRGEGAPPRELQLAWYATRWGALPESGGILDQPAGLLKKMALTENIYNAARGKRDAKDAAKWADSNPTAWELYAWARKLEMDNGN